MGLFDKVKNAVNTASEKASDALQKGKESFNQFKEEREKSKQPQEGGIKRYEVTYRGGHPEYPMSKEINKYPYIIMDVMPDRFSFLPKQASEPWFRGYDIPYSKVISIELVERTMSFTESMLGSGSDNSDLRQKNVMEITYLDDNNDEYVVRNEMLTGTSVMGQARVCLEMMDLLRANKIPQQFIGKKSDQNVIVNQTSAADELKKYKDLLDAGIISQEEFEEKKKQLLNL